jgi:imidazole glycerol phosphate synthase subunit HisF
MLFKNLLITLIMIFCMNMLFKFRVGEGSADEFGSQSVIVLLDVRKYNSGEYSVYVMA